MLLLVVAILETDEHSISFVGVAPKTLTLIRKAQLCLDYFSQLDLLSGFQSVNLSDRNWDNARKL